MESTIYKQLKSYLAEINIDTENNFTLGIQPGGFGDYFKLYNNDTLLTGGDCYDIEDRVKQIARENGIQINYINLDNFEE